MNRIEKARLLDRVQHAESASVEEMAGKFIAIWGYHAEIYVKKHVSDPAFHLLYPAEVLMLVKRQASGKWSSAWKKYDLAESLLMKLESLAKYVENLSESERFDTLLELRKLYIQWILNYIVGIMLDQSNGSRSYSC